MTQALEVRFVDLPDMTVASALGFGKEPEHKAAEMMNAFAAPRGIEPGSKEHPSFGFNNPNPSPGSENYGYELWVRVEPGTKAEDPVVIKEIPAASYAVTRFTGLSNIGRVWQQFAAWYEDKYASVPACEMQCWLESLQTPSEPDQEKWIFDLYLVIDK
jgi:DNA gyrase inhibitor GyrI